MSIDRRKFIQRAGVTGLAAGAAWSAPVVIRSVGTSAWAAGTSVGPLPMNPSNTPTQVTIPKGRQVNYEIVGGGGGGGFWNSFNGGSGVKVTGVIGASASAITLDVWLGGGGAGATNRAGGAGGVGYNTGGSGGHAGSGSSGNGGGGGGGATAIVSDDGSSVIVVAAGGGGAGGGGDNAGKGFAGPGYTVTPNTTWDVTSPVAGHDGISGSGNYPGGQGRGGGASSGGAGGLSYGGSYATDGAPGSTSSGGTGGRSNNDACGNGGGGGGGHRGGGGGGGATYGNTYDTGRTPPPPPSYGDSAYYAGGGGGGTGSSIAHGPSGTTGTATYADPRSPTTTNGGGTLPGHCGKGGYSRNGGTASEGQAGGNGSVTMTLV